CEPGQVPQCYGRLVVKSIAPHAVNRTERARWIIRVEECAGPVIDGLPGNSAVISVHHAVNKSKLHPPRNELCLPGDDLVEETKGRCSTILSVREMSFQR